MKRRRIIVALLMLTTSFSTFASVKYYRSTTDIPFVEMMINMMVAMGMLDRVPVGGYGGYPASFGSPYSSWGNYSSSPWSSSPWGGLGTSPWGASPYTGSPYAGSPYAVSPWGDSPYNAGQWGGMPWGGTPYGGVPYRGSRYAGSPWGGSPYAGSPWAGSPYNGGQWGAMPWGGAPYGGTPYRGSRYGAPHRGVAPYRGSPWGGSPYGAAPWGNSPYAGAPWGASPFATRPWRPGYASYNSRPYPYTNRWGRRLPPALNAYSMGYPVSHRAGVYPRRISDPLFAESGICPSGLCDRIQVKQALEGVWKNESGETLTIKDNRFDWSDGGERKLSGKMRATIKDLVATVDDYDKEIRYRYMIKNNELITRDDKGMTRVFHRQPEDKGEKL